MKHCTALAVLAIAGSVAAAPHGHGLHLARDIAATSTISARSAEAEVDPPAPTVAGITPGCTKWWTVSAGDYCQKIADAEVITLDQFYAWNPQVNTNGACASLWAGYAYCVRTTGALKSHSSAPVPAQAPAPAPAPASAPAPPPAPSSAPGPVPTSAPAPPPAPTTTTQAAPTSAPAPAPAPVNPSVYTSYNGDGSLGQGWPAITSWATFDSIWDGNLHWIQNSCTNSGWGDINNSDHETEVLKASIKSVAADAKLDERFVLAIVLQESWGCVRVKTTYWPYKNPGLMQDHEGDASCFGVGANACSDDMIKQMIVEGTKGTRTGDGLMQLYQNAASKGLSGAQQYYVAARLYNGGTGSFVASDLHLSGGTASYASDVANKLVGFLGGKNAFVAA